MSKSNTSTKTINAVPLLSVTDPFIDRVIGTEIVTDIARTTGLDIVQTMAVPYARGKSGKSKTSRLLVECAKLAGIPMRYSDADPSNAGLKETYGDAISPVSVNPQDLIAHTRTEVEEFVDGGASCLIDYGAGNPTFEACLQEIDLSRFIKEHGKRLLLFCLLGPTRGDLSYIDEFLRHPSLTAADVVLCCNEGLTERGREIQAFEPCLESPQVRAAIGRGARLIRLPRLHPAERIEALGLTYLDAALRRPNGAGQSLGALDAGITAQWLRQLPQAFAPIRDWLTFAPVESLVATMEAELTARVAARADRGAVA